jgi:hypothetical protein
LQLFDELHFKIGLKFVPKFGFQHEVLAALKRLYGTSETPLEAIQVADDTTGME